jgi:hypothetical protein
MFRLSYARNGSFVKDINSCTVPLGSTRSKAWGTT